MCGVSCARLAESGRRGRVMHRGCMMSLIWVHKNKTLRYYNYCMPYWILSMTFRSVSGLFHMQIVCRLIGDLFLVAMVHFCVQCTAECCDVEMFSFWESMNVYFCFKISYLRVSVNKNTLEKFSQKIYIIFFFTFNVLDILIRKYSKSSIILLTIRVF